MHTQRPAAWVCMNTHAATPHTLPNPQSQRVCRTPSHIIPRDNASSKCTHPNPLISTLPPSLSTPIYLLSPTPPVTQQLRPANPLWKETTEQKITSPPLSHTPSLPFVFSSGLLLTPSSDTTNTTTGRCLFPSTFLFCFLQMYSSPLLSDSLYVLWGKLYVFTPSSSLSV